MIPAASSVQLTNERTNESFAEQEEEKTIPNFFQHFFVAPSCLETTYLPTTCGNFLGTVLHLAIQRPLAAQNAVGRKNEEDCERPTCHASKIVSACVRRWNGCFMMPFLVGRCWPRETPPRAGTIKKNCRLNFFPPTAPPCCTIVVDDVV